MSDKMISTRSGVSERDWRIFDECNETGEPYIGFRAKDQALPAILAFAERAYVELGCDADFLDAIASRGEAVEQWHEEMPGTVKTPDLRPGEGVEP